jgi:hypothetical protein
LLCTAYAGNRSAGYSPTNLVKLGTVKLGDFMLLSRYKMLKYEVKYKKMQHSEMKGFKAHNTRN